MERTQAVERLIAALAPAVSAEVERALEEAQQKLNQEHATQLQAAALEAQAEARRAVEGEIQRAAQQGAEAARRELMLALEPQIRLQIEEARREARERMQADLEAVNQQAKEAQAEEKQSATAERDRLEAQATAERDRLQAQATAERDRLQAEATAERDRLQTQLADWRLLAGAEIRLIEADSQMEMLARFMKLAGGFADSMAVYVSRPEGLTLWKSRGPKTFPKTITEQTAEAGMYVRAIAARGKPVAAVAAVPGARRDALDFLTGCLERSIKLLGLKLQNPPSSEPPAGGAETLHAEAREAARTLVSEIASKREMEIIHGRVNSDIYQRLHGEIESARQQYLERVPCVIAASRDYFDEELVRALAENHPALMGAGFPGARD